MNKDEQEKEFNTIVSKHKMYTIISFENSDQLDLYNVHDLVGIFKDGNAKGTLDWVVDLSGIEFVDSSGLGALANQAIFLSKASKKLIILNPNTGLKNLFSVTGFEKIFMIVVGKENL